MMPVSASLLLLACSSLTTIAEASSARRGGSSSRTPGLGLEGLLGGLFSREPGAGVAVPFEGPLLSLTDEEAEERLTGTRAPQGSVVAAPAVAGTFGGLTEDRAVRRAWSRTAAIAPAPHTALRSPLDAPLGAVAEEEASEADEAPQADAPVALAANKALANRAALPAEEYDVDDQRASGGGFLRGGKFTSEDLRLRQRSLLSRAAGRDVQEARNSHHDESAVAVNAKKGEQSIGGKRVGFPSPLQRMKAQCMKFAEFVKAQGVKGPAFVKLWKSSCEPAIVAGEAPPKFQQLCSAIAAAVEPFANYDERRVPAGLAAAPEGICEAIVSAFQASGVGASPLVDTL